MLVSSALTALSHPIILPPSLPSLGLVSRPRTLPIPGFDKEGVYLLREPSQANAIAQKALGKKVVIIGTSFIGMEVGAYLVDKAVSVDCIDIAPVPFERVLGERIGRSLQKVRKLKITCIYPKTCSLSIHDHRCLCYIFHPFTLLCCMLIAGLYPAQYVVG